MAGGEEALLEGFEVGLGLGTLLPPVIHGGVGQADHDPAKGAQHARGVGMAHAALILVQGHIQTMVQPTLNHPVAALEPQQPRRL